MQLTQQNGFLPKWNQPNPPSAKEVMSLKKTYSSIINATNLPNPAFEFVCN